MNNIAKYDYLTSLRGIAAIWVVFYHIANYLEDYLTDWIILIIGKGHLAVDFFFLLSGFIITLNYERNFIEFKWSNYKNFLIKRIARIYPLHLFVLLAYLIIPLAYFITNKAMPDGDKYSLLNYVYHLILVNNWGLGNTISWNTPAWSISTEWAAYLFFPLTVIILTRIKVSYAPFYIALLCLVIYLVFSMHGYESLGKNIPGLGIFRCLIEFLMGGIVCRYSQQYTLKNISAYFLLCVAVILILLVFCNVVTEIVFAPIVLVIGLLSLLYLHNSQLACVLRVKPLMFLGDISYSIYLVHFWLRDVLKLFLDKDAMSIFWIGLYFITVLVLSFFTYKFIEIPARKRVVNMFSKHGKLNTASIRKDNA